MLRGLFGLSKEKLIAQMGSKDNKLVLEAITQLRAKGWFRDGSLRGVRLHEANLQNAPLAKADLEGAILLNANLTKAYLGETILRKADLMGAHLCEANMRNIVLTEANLAGANLNGAYLPDARLDRANLSGAKLQGINLWGARLHGANLQGTDMREALLYRAQFDIETILPDGTCWTAETDMSRFTDPQHMHFWSLNGAHKPD
jgi:hypothetical protein